MTNDYTFAMIKPYAFSKNHVGPILAIICQSGFRIIALKTALMTREKAELFYGIHKGKEFFEPLVNFMISGPVVAMILEKDNAVEDFRKLIGNTNPELAEEGTIRKKFAESLQRNAIHGADSFENAKRESDFFFSTMERY